ncbi:MAG TPA: HD domain-containing protein [Nitrolancea sp.]|nr:HD domain-containing protein [Nitrolancea sp.]
MKLQARRFFARASGRIAQGVGYLAPRRAAAIDAELQRLLNAAEFELVRPLTVADRAHLLAVYQRLQRLGCRDADVFTAGLLHDVGKVDGDVRVGLVHRTVAVLLGAISPKLIDRLARSEGGRWRRPFQLVNMHPRRGARLARDVGCNQRVCWLIEHHHDTSVKGDAGLWLLQQADGG